MEEKFILLYDRSSQSFKVDSTRTKLFLPEKNIAFENVQNTSAALKYHIQRAVF